MVGLFPTVRGKPVGMSEPDESDSIDALCSELADLIEERPTVAVAESLTGGGIAESLEDEYELRHPRTNAAKRSSKAP